MFVVISASIKFGSYLDNGRNKETIITNGIITNDLVSIYHSGTLLSKVITKITIP
jgi:hypothetical protein